jgi:hypothetical protein
MPGMMMPSSQSSKSAHNTSSVGGNLQHNLLLQQGLTSSQLGEKIFKTSRIKFITEKNLPCLGQIPQGYSTAGHNLHNPYDTMDAYQSL